MNFALSKIPLNIVGPNITGGPGSNVSSAAGAVNLSNAWKSNRATAPKFGDIAAESMLNRAKLFATAEKIKGDTHQQGLATLGGIAGTKAKAEAIKDTAKEEAGSSLFGSGVKLAGVFATTALLGGCDETIKDNIEAIEDALSTLRALRPVTFNYKEEWSASPERLHHGFIAQEYKEVLPDATYYDEEHEKYCIDTGELIGLLVRAVQQLETKVTRLEAANALVGVKS